jgi:hypothetical protein
MTHYKVKENTSNVQKNNYNPVIDELNNQLSQITELKVKSIRKLSEKEIAQME